MTSDDLKAALDALNLTEADMDDVRIVEDGAHGRLILARYHAGKEGVHLVLVHMDGERVTRMRLSGKLAGVVAEVVAAIDEDE